MNMDMKVETKYRNNKNNKNTTTTTKHKTVD